MIVERALTAYLRREFSRIMRLSDFRDLTPPQPQPDKEYLIYIHVPFCETLCPYCSFHRIELDTELCRAYFDALRTEIRMYVDRGFRFAAAYIGGGTPTVLPDEIAALLDDLKRKYLVKEISLETNPNHLNDEVIGMLKSHGVNRLSVGVQTFEDSLLKEMGRFQKYGSGAEIRERITRYRETFDTLNVDMIFNFPTQTREMLHRDLQAIKEIQADQVTFYPLMVSDSTRGRLSDLFGPISLRKEKLFYQRILDGLGDSYTCGTAWCFSRKKSMIDEYIVDYDEYVGAGSGAFGYVNGTVFSDTFSIRRYIDEVNRGRFPLQALKEFSQKERVAYDFVMKLFGTSLDVGKAEAKFQGAFRRNLMKELALFRLIGAVTEENGSIRLTRKGQYIWVVIMREFFIAVNNFMAACLAALETSTWAQAQSAEYSAECR